MYIEGNALILGDSSYLEHHGILGQKWGVRRFQNKDGTRTAAGKARDQKNAAKKVVLANRRTRNQWQYQNSFTKAQDKLTNDSRDAVRKMAVDALNGERTDEYKTAVEEYDAATNYRYDEYRKEAAKYEAIAGMASGQRYPMLDPDKFDQDTRLKWDAEFYMYDDGDQGKYNSYDYFLVAKGENPNKVFDRAMKARNNIESIADKDVDDILGDYKEHPINSKVLNTTIKTTAGDALKERIVDMATSLSDYTMVWEHQISYTDDEIKQMKDDIKKYSKEAARLGLTHSDLFIEDGTLYLSHHGIRGQRWGVRRFQNRDGSLTNAGRKRLGYATKGAVQTVGKAFKAGVKVGGNAVKAAKAHHEKKEAEKLEKKKEKASKTRLGVMANKDLFTDAELKKLNDRFKLEDEMKMATLNKGVEIAKAIGTIAQNVGYAAKAYEDVTGQSLSPIKRKAAEEKARQDKEDRERKIAREDAEEARKAAKEERDIAIHEQTLRKAIAAADTQEFTAQKTKAEADSSVLDAIKKGQDFNGGGDAKTDATGQSWMEKATSGGKNVFEQMKYDSDPDYKAAKDAHDEKVEWQQHEKERDARIAARERGIQPENESGGKQNPQQPQSKSQPQPQSQPQQKKSDDGDDDRGGFAKLKEALPFDKGRYVNRKAAEKAKDVKESAEEERTKKQDEKAAKAAIDTIIKDYQHQDDTVRSMNPTKYDREVAASVIKGKAKNALNKVTHPVDAVAKKISDKAREEKWTKERAKLFEEYQDNREKLGTEFANEAYVRAKKQSLQNLGYRGEALDKKLNETPFSKRKKAKHDAFTIQNGVLFIDSSDGLAHHGVKGQRWGVRRFQNEDGSLTPKGRKHYEKALAREKRKQASSDAIRGTLERQHPFAVTGAAVLGAVAAGMSIAATGGASAAMIAAGSAISAAVSASLTHVTYSASEAWEGRGTRMRSKKIAKYENMLKQSDREDGMYHVENGTFFINAGEPYLEHHGVLGMKWGKHLRAGKGPVDGEAGGGGGFAEDDEKLKEMAKKAGMSVAEYKQKFASKIGGAASKVGEKVYDAAGGKYKKEARDLYRKAESIDRESESSKREQSSLHASSNRKREVAKQWDSEAKEAAAEARRANNLATQAGSTAKAYSERAKAKKEAAAKAKVPKMSRDPKTPHPFGSTGVREQDDKINSWADDINRNNKMTRSGWRRKANYEMPKKDFEKAAQDIHNGKKNVTLSEGAAAYALAREQQAVRRRRHSATIGSGDEKKAKELNGIKREMEESGAIARRAQQSAKKTRDRINDDADMDSLYAKTAGRAASSQARAAKRKRVEAKEARAKYEKSLAGKYDKFKANITKKKSVLTSGRKRKQLSTEGPKAKKQISNARDDVEKAARANENAYKHAKAVYRQTGSDSDAYKQAIKRSGTTLQRYIDSKKLLEKKKRAKHSDDTNAVYTEGTRLVVNSKWG